MKTIALARVAGLVAAFAPAMAKEAGPSIKDRVADGIKDKLGTAHGVRPHSLRDLQHAVGHGLFDAVPADDVFRS